MTSTYGSYVNPEIWEAAIEDYKTREQEKKEWEDAKARISKIQCPYCYAFLEGRAIDYKNKICKCKCCRRIIMRLNDE